MGGSEHRKRARWTLPSIPTKGLQWPGLPGAAHLLPRQRVQRAQRPSWATHWAATDGASQQTHSEVPSEGAWCFEVGRPEQAKHKEAVQLLQIGYRGPGSHQISGQQLAGHSGLDSVPSFSEATEKATLSVVSVEHNSSGGMCLPQRGLGHLTYTLLQM